MGLSGVFAAFNPFTEEFEHWNNDIDTDAAEPTFGAWTKYATQHGSDASESPSAWNFTRGGILKPMRSILRRASPADLGRFGILYVLHSMREASKTARPWRRPLRPICAPARGISDSLRISTVILERAAGNLRIAAVRRIAEDGTQCRASAGVTALRMVLRLRMMSFVLCRNGRSGNETCTIWSNWPIGWSLHQVSITEGGIGLEYIVNRETERTVRVPEPIIRTRRRPSTSASSS